MAGSHGTRYPSLLNEEKGSGAQCVVERGDREGGDERRGASGTEEETRGYGSGEVFLSTGGEAVWIYGGKCCAILGVHDLPGESLCRLWGSSKRRKLILSCI